MKVPIHRKIDTKRIPKSWKPMHRAQSIFIQLVLSAVHAFVFAAYFVQGQKNPFDVSEISTSPLPNREKYSIIESNQPHRGT